MSAQPQTYTARDARNAGRSYQHLAAVVNRLLNRIMETVDDGAAKAFRPVVFHTVHALHAFFHGRDLSKKDLIKSHQFVVPYFDYRGDPKNSAAFMGARLDALRAAELAAGREFVTIQRADNKTLLFTHYKAHPLLDAAESVYLQARQSPDYWTNPAAAVTVELLDAAIEKLPRVERPARPEAQPEPPPCGHPAGSELCEACGEDWEAADLMAAQVLKGRWTKWENSAREILVAEFDKGGDPELVAEARAAKIIELGREIKKKLARERLRGFDGRTPDEIADSPARREGDIGTDEILAEVAASPRTADAHSGKDSVRPSDAGPAPHPKDFSLGSNGEGPRNQEFTESTLDESAPDDEDARLACALDYARQGLAVLALWGCADAVCDCPSGSECRTVGKHPHSKLARNGAYSATTDAATIRKWFARDARINIGVAMGGPLNLVCVDVDPRNDGDASYCDLVEAHGPDAFPDTFTVRTGGGGWHRLYKLPEEIKPEKGELKGKLGPGVDIKGAGGQIVGVGSVHASGRRYEVENNTYIAPAPEWMVKALRKAAEGGEPEKVIDFQAHRDRRRSGVGGSTIVEGERNERLFKVGCALWGKGEVRSRSDLLARLMEVNCERVSPPLDSDEVWKIAESVSRYPLGVPIAEGGAA